MSKDKRGFGNAELVGKLKNQVFKQFQKEHLIKDITVILESKLTESKERVLQSAREFEVV